MGQVAGSQEMKNKIIEISSRYNDDGELFQEILEELLLLYIIEKLD